ncbi:hypothetical protein GCM10018777_11270 [Streptomyces albogriseolus]|uniref:DUF5134 domain-containing protein n=1 Tax=Streptomyces albogriseolus TaxID=1887 RepID=UPI0016756365|nr:DUF5134 domain-containing protein [Streptomyces viridodiastaticus]MCX4570636.1 DUF5134 domain-containing protein [Streptomyces viridodiastaticus]GHG02240.1 hypothetical protein GCM10018777_11270 [Streptomyces viridodiastaticus]
MGILALSWVIALVSALVAAVSAVRVVTTSGEIRFAAGGDLLMGLCMAAMALPATVGWYAGYGMWWAVVFGVLGLGGVAMAVKHTRAVGWKHGRHWVHLIVGSFGMVIMTLAMTSTSSGPVLALGSGHSMAHMPGMENTASATGTHEMEGMEGMHGAGSMHGMDMPGMTNAAADAGSSAGSGSVWRFVIAALAVYFLLSIGASVWARVRGTRRSGRGAGSLSGWSRWLLAMPDTVLVYLASLTLSVWDRTRMGQRSGHGRRRKLGAAPDAALAAHIGMGGTMSAMLLMMAA